MFQTQFDSCQEKSPRRWDSRKAGRNSLLLPSGSGLDSSRVPPDQSLASRSAVKSACIFSNGVYEAGRSEGAGHVIKPRNSVVVVIGITALGSQRGKADGVSIPEGSSLGGVMAKSLGHRRGLRAGHALTGATRELGRACCLPPEEPKGMGHRLNKGPCVGRVMHRAHRNKSYISWEKLERVLLVYPLPRPRILHGI